MEISSWKLMRNWASGAVPVFVLYSSHWLQSFTDYYDLQYENDLLINGRIDAIKLMP